MSGLLIPSPVMFEPAVDMPALRVLVCPVDHATAIIGLKLTVERNAIALGYRANAWREINVVSHKHRSARGQSQDKPLVTATVVVIGKHTVDRAAPADLAA